MPTTLRSRAALFAAAAVMFLPALSLSPRGITHLLTCRQSSQTPFTLVIHPGSRPVLATSLEEAGNGNTTLCGGLALDPPPPVRIRFLDRSKAAPRWAAKHGIPPLPAVL